MSRRLLRHVSALMTVVFYTVVIAPSAAMAQGFDFDEDEVDDFSEPMDFGDDEGFDADDWGDDSWEDDGWGEEPSTSTQPADDGVITVTGLFVPGGALDAATADGLTASLLDALGTLPGYVTVSNAPLRAEFDIMGARLAQECALDPVCLGRYGRNLGIDKIVVGRAEGSGANWSTTIDLVDAGSSAIENYRYFTTEPRAAAIEGALTPQLRTLFGLRPVDTGGVARRTGPSPAQRAMAWTTLGLSVAALGAGVAFGLQASGTSDDLDNCTLLDGADGSVVCDITQVEAQQMIDDGKRQALMSNIFLGSGLFLGVTSIILFVITPGGDIDEDADLAQAPRRLRLAPSVTRDGFGVAGSLSF